MSSAPARGRDACPPVSHDLMLRVARGAAARGEAAPAWAMRQAGRYLPEFQALRGFNFLARVHTPALAAEVTLQPLRRYARALDAVVIFSDILIVPPAMGLPVVFAPGPQFARLLASPADLDGLDWAPDVRAHFGWLLEAITLTRRLAAAAPGAPFALPPAVAGDGDGGDPHRLPAAQLPPGLLDDMRAGRCSVGKAVPVIGFVGAPWTLMTYMIDGDLMAPPAAAAAAAPVEAAPAPTGPVPGARGLVAHKTYERSKRWLYHHPEAAHRLLAGITRILVELLVAQYEAGADVLQVFETNADALPPARFVEFAQPYLLRLAAEVRARTAPAAAGGPALSIFAKGATHALAALAAPDSNYDVISLDWNTDPAAAVATVRAAATASGAAPKVLQGNLDPGELFGSPQTIAAATADMLTRFDGHPLIANLGHGMLPSHTPEALGAFFDAVKAHAGK